MREFACENTPRPNLCAAAERAARALYVVERWVERLLALRLGLPAHVLLDKAVPDSLDRLACRHAERVCAAAKRPENR